MTDTELRAAAERVQSTKGTTIHAGGYNAGPDGRRQYDEDCESLADAVIQLLPPADDGVGVTAEWLKAVGFKPHDKIPTGLGLACEVNEDGDTRELFYQPDSFYPWRLFDEEDDVASLPDQPTRGHVRRLALALGITLTESTP